MSKIVGMLRGKKIYDNDPLLWRLQCDVEYVSVWGNVSTSPCSARCDYCGRTGQDGNECKTCGAPL